MGVGIENYCGITQSSFSTIKRCLLGNCRSCIQIQVLLAFEEEDSSSPEKRKGTIHQQIPSFKFTQKCLACYHFSASVDIIIS
jgi:hypothetical protein